MNSGWWSDDQKKRSLPWIAFFVILNIAIPLITIDLYPFSRGPMFSDSPRQYSQFQVTSPVGDKLDLMEFGLHRIYWGNPPGSGTGYFLPPTLDQFGSAIPTSIVVQQIQEKLRTMPDLPSVDVVQESIGDLDGNQVGVVSREKFKVENPLFSRKKKG